jgi:nucleotide-binding universal stress UspA family protein
MSIFPTKILLATDGSREARLALRAAVDLANATNSELHVFTAGSWLPPGYDIPDYGEQFEEAFRVLELRVRELLDRQVEKIEEGGGKVAKAHLRMQGRPDQQIVRLAEEIGTGLIVVGSRGLGGVRRALMGSVSESVVRHAHCPVLVVREAEDGEPIFPLRKRILLATDGSGEAEVALQAAAELAASTHSELHVLTVGGEYRPGQEVAVGPGLFEETRRELKQEARELLGEQVKKIEEAGGIAPETHLKVGGRADQEIVGLAEEIGAGLIIVGSRGRGGIGRALMGSVSDSVVRHAHCPVLVMRKEEELAQGMSLT